ncbi:EamA family transporter [Streptomyces sp. NPDC090077]|uniref:EamA family transporter n=1 Tax=Streptomyces sp. NPDC090077 TaxID=3365938 RepID=UPI0037FD47E1
MKGSRSLGDSALTVLAPVVWGSTYLVTTEFLPEGRPLLSSLLRALPAGLILVLIGRVLPKGIWWWRALVLGVLNIGAFFYLLFVAAYHLPGGVAALVMAIQPMIVLLLGAALLKERIRRMHVAACALGTAGVGLLVLQPNAGLNATGVIAGLLGALSMASGIVLTKRWGRPEGVGLLSFTGWQLTVGGLVLLPVTLIGEGLPGEITAENLWGFAYLGIIGALVAYAIWFRGVQRLPALTVSFLSFGSPLTATLLGWFVLDQSLSPLQILGALTVIASVALAQPRQPKQPEPEPDPDPGPERAAATSRESVKA